MTKATSGLVPSTARSLHGELMSKRSMQNDLQTQKHQSNLGSPVHPMAPLPCMRFGTSKGTGMAGKSASLAPT